MRHRLHEFNQAVLKESSSSEIPASVEENVIVLENKSARFVKNFLIKVEDICKMFSETDPMIQNATELHATLLEFGETDEKLFSLYENIRKNFMKIANKITGLEKSFAVTNFPGSNTDLRICCTQVLTLKQKLTNSVSNYYNIQEEYKEQCKERMKRQAEISGADVSEMNFDSAIKNKTEFFIQAIFPDYNFARYYMNEIKKRHEDFLRLEKSILQLRDLIFNVNMILMEDTALINRIDKHVYAVLDYVMEGAESVEDFRSSKTAEKIKCYFCFCCIGIVIFLIIVAVVAAYT